MYHGRWVTFKVVVSGASVPSWQVRSSMPQDRSVSVYCTTLDSLMLTICQKNGLLLDWIVSLAMRPTALRLPSGSPAYSRLTVSGKNVNASKKLCASGLKLVTPPVVRLRKACVPSTECRTVDMVNVSCCRAT